MPDDLWCEIRGEVAVQARQEPLLASFFHSTVLNHDSLAQAIGYHLASRLEGPVLPAMLLREVFEQAMRGDPGIIEAAARDIVAYQERDPACDFFSEPLLYSKGFHAVQSQRMAHWLWGQKRYSLALYLQNRISSVFDVDIHPGAKLGHGLMIDHATGVVMGETTVVGDNVSILHAVTLGGSGVTSGKRHPQIGDWVLISAGAKILGNVNVGEGAKIGAGSLVLMDVAPRTTVAGVPARVVGVPKSDQPALDMNHQLHDSQ
jgi:serine O-acetyltransferase